MRPDGGPAGPTEQRTREVWDRLARVVDPELDEAVTELDFVSAVTVSDDGEVAVGFRLPTYWCAANFAFLMADDMRREVAALPWVRRVALTLHEHMYAEQINRGMEQGLSFGATFGAEAEGEDVEDIRRTFALKAFQRRQEALLRHLLAAGEPAGRLLALSVGELAACPADPETDRLVRRYLERRDLAGTGDDPARLAFVDTEGRPIEPERLAAYLSTLRGVAVNVEFNGVLCRGLLAARYGEPAPDPTALAEPGLLDFIRALPRDPAVSRP